uniref:Uncharacterized protein n=1 Tax=Glossina morsitans morsitans TaxID=37546 RepID=A0ABK9NFZ1_GLOMM
MKNMMQTTFVGKTCIADATQHKTDGLYQPYYKNSARPQHPLQGEQPTQMQNTKLYAFEEAISGRKDNYLNNITGEFLESIHSERRKAIQFMLPYFSIIGVFLINY